MLWYWIDGGLLLSCGWVDWWVGGVGELGMRLGVTGLRLTWGLFACLFVCLFACWFGMLMLCGLVGGWYN